jgi:hypothetical protein
LFFYAQGMPVVVTQNQFVGLKVVNGRREERSRGCMIKF